MGELERIEEGRWTGLRGWEQQALARQLCDFQSSDRSGAQEERAGGGSGEAREDGGVDALAQQEGQGGEREGNERGRQEETHDGQGTPDDRNERVLSE